MDSLNSKEMRKISLSRLSPFWVESEYIILMRLSVFFICVVGLYIYYQIGYGQIDISTIPTQIMEFIKKPNIGILVFIFLLFLAISVAMAPFKISTTYCYYQVAKGKNPPLSSLFDLYKSVKRWKNIFHMDLFIKIYTIPVFIFGSVIFYFCAYSMHFVNKMVDSNIFIAVLCAILGIIYGILIFLYTFYIGRFFLVPFYFAENPDASIKEIYKKSINLSSKYRKMIFDERIKFIPAFFCCLLIFPIFIVSPIYNIIMATYAVKIIEAEKENG